MLIFVSDLHLAESGFEPTIDLRAFGERLTAIVDGSLLRGAPLVKLILLGDIFEILKSKHWCGDLKPWDNCTDRHIEVVAKIVNDILKNNSEFVRLLGDLQRKYSGRFVVRYVLGNHDRLLGEPMGKHARAHISKNISLEPGCGLTDTVFICPNHGVLAWHGHEFDPDNKPSVGGGPILGEVIVVELLEKLKRGVAKEIGWQADDTRLRFLSELDNVQPHDVSQLGAWIATHLRALALNHNDKALKDVIVKQIASCLTTVNSHSSLLPISKHSLVWGLEKYVNHVLGKRPILPSSLLDLENHADKLISATEIIEKTLASQDDLDLDIFVMGHTHIPTHMTTRFSSDGQQRKLIYLNSGTWRRVHKATFGTGDNVWFQTYDENTTLIVYDVAEANIFGCRYEYMTVIQAHT